MFQDRQQLLLITMFQLLKADKPASELLADETQSQENTKNQEFSF